MSELANALRDLEEKRVYALVDEKLSQGVSALDIIEECNEGMVAVGELFSEKKYFISQLIFSAEILKTVINRLDPLLEGTPKRDSIGKVVIGTVKGDIHDIGKNIVTTLLRGSGFEVVDLGVDVSTERFIEAIKESGAKVLGMSALLSTTYPEMKNVVNAIDDGGLREHVKIIIGGAPVNEQVRQFTGADYYAEDAVTGINLCKEIYA
ncbi:MAG: cobalamin-binding protein [Proteobacteria bacterium]|nr:cobalamin-binding protein [Pseudomonadota bacterium]